MNDQTNLTKGMKSLNYSELVGIKNIELPYISRSCNNHSSRILLEYKCTLQIHIHICIYKHRSAVTSFQKVKNVEIDGRKLVVKLRRPL